MEVRNERTTKGLRKKLQPAQPIQLNRLGSGGSGKDGLSRCARVGVVFASKARYGQGPAAARVVRWGGAMGWCDGVWLQWGAAGWFSGVPQRGTAYQPRVKPWVRDTPSRCVLKERRIAVQARLSASAALGVGSQTRSSAGA
jgi:hypothetical protein